MNCSEFVAKISYFVDGEMLQGERASAQAHLKDCASCAKVYTTRLQSVDLIKESLASNKLSQDFTAKVSKLTKTKHENSKQISIRFVTWFAGVAAVLLISLGIGTYFALQPKIQVISGLANVSDGHVLTTDQKASIRLVDQTIARLDPRTEIVVEKERRVRLVKGSAFFQVAHRSDQFKLVSEQGEVTVLGTKFSTSIEDRVLKVHVLEGRVQVKNVYGQEILRSGEMASLKQDEKPSKVDADPMTKLKELIKLLGDNDPATRDKAQDEIIKLIKEEAGAKRDIKQLVKELEQEQKETKNDEVRIRLTGVLDKLKHGIWEKIKEAPIEERLWHTSVLFGNKLVIWGGCGMGGKTLSDGAILDLEKMKWEKLPETDLKGRYHHRAVLWGSKMVVWGGISLDGVLDGVLSDGAILDLEKMKWEKLPNAGIKRRMGHTCILWGSKMVIWGGRIGYPCEKDDPPTCILSDGAILDLEKMKWEKIPADAKATGRNEHSTVLCGSKMLVWGGQPDAGASPLLSDGAIYDLEKREWEKLPESPLKGRFMHSATVCDSKMIIWGGASTSLHSDGAMFDFEKKEWEKLPKSPISGRYWFSMVPLTLNVVVWGGCDGKYVSDGAIFDLKNKKWKKLAKPADFSGRMGHTAIVWRSKMIIWGGTYDGGSNVLSDGAIYELPILWD